MKWLLVLALAVASLTLVISHHDDDYEEVYNACEKEQEIDSANESNEQKLHCMYRCLIEKTGLVDKDGHYNITVVESYVHGPLTPEQKEGIKKCETQQKNASNICQQSWDTALCVDGVLPPISDKKENTN